MNRYKPYPKYRESGVEWLGEVPEHWKIQKLKYIAHTQPSNVDKKSKENEQNVLLCNYTDVYKNELITNEIDFMKATATHEQIKKFKLEVDDVIFTKDSEDPEDIAIAAYVKETQDDLICGYHLTQIKPKNCNGAYLYRAFNSSGIHDQFKVAANGITRYGLSVYAVDNALFPVPPKQEQTIIANFLDRETAKIDTLIAKQERLIALLAEKRQALISHAVTKGLDPNVKMKDSGVEWLGEVPEHWEVGRIGNYFTEIVEHGKTDLPILRVSIHNGVSDREYSSEEMNRKVTRSEDKTKYKCVQPNDLVYNMMRAWQGGFGAVKVKGLVSPAYVVSRPIKEVNTKFVELLLRTKTATEEMKRFSKGITDFRLRLYWDEFKNLKIMLPPKDEADKILNYIEQQNTIIDRLIEKNTQAIALLKERRTALISAVVMGKIDVRGEIREEAKG